MHGGVCNFRPQIAFPKVQEQSLGRRLSKRNSNDRYSKGKQSQGRVQPSLDQLDIHGFQANSSTYASLIRLCSNAKSLLDGKRVHHHIARNGFDGSTLLGSLLIHMYGECGAVENASAVFANMHERNVFTWNVIIQTFAQQQQEKAALRLFKEMQREEVTPDRVTFLSCLSACGSHAEVNWIYSLVLTNGIDTDPIVGTAVVSMYGKCGNLDDAQRTFDKLSVRTVVSWNAIIGAYAQNGKETKALQLFQQMQLDIAQPNRITFVTILDAYASKPSLCDGMRFHALITDSGFESDVAVGNALVTMYGRCGLMDDAHNMFERIQERNVVSWNSIISVYANNGHGKGVISLFKQMQQESIMPNKVTYVSMLAAFDSRAFLAHGKWIHAHMVGSEFKCDVVAGNSLVNMYGKCDTLDSAQRMFESMPVQNVVSWNALLSLHAQQGQGEKAIEFFELMLQKGVMPNKVTFINILSACASRAVLDVGRHVHALVVSHGLVSDPVIGTALVNMYGKCTRVEDACRIFSRMHTVDVVPWNAMIATYIQNGHGKDALNVFNQMQREGIIPDKVTFLRVLEACTTELALLEGMQIHSLALDLGFESDIAVGTALLQMYGKCGRLMDACRVFDQLSEQNVISSTAMIAVYVQNARHREALDLYFQMQCNGVRPNKVTFITILDACVIQTAFVEGEQIHADIIASGFELEVMVGTALVNMYGKCGKVEEAKGVFESMGERNVVCMNAMIAVYAQNGQGIEALLFFEEMQWKGIIPDQATFIGVLSACSHAGMVAEACKIFVAMDQDCGITPGVDHYNCMIDLLGRAGRLDEAEALVNGMPLEPTVASFMALLGACRHQADVDRGERAAYRVIQLAAGKASAHVVLSSIYMSAGRGEEVQKS